MSGLLTPNTTTDLLAKESNKNTVLTIILILLTLVLIAEGCLSFLKPRSELAACSTYEDGFVKFLGFKDVSDCEALQKLALENIINECAGSFATIDKNLYQKCIDDKIDLENLGINKQHVLFLQSI